jgi:hypothetical protein
MEKQDEIIIDPKETKVKRVLELAQQTKPYLTYAEIGNLVGFSRQRVSQICLEHRIIRRPNDVKTSKWEKHWDINTEVE